MQSVCYNYNMKKLILFTLVIYFFNIPSISAHKGRTDGNGGHTCWTNCTYWGLEYGEYHYHNGTSSSNRRSLKNNDSISSTYYDEQDIVEDYINEEYNFLINFIMVT